MSDRRPAAASFRSGGPSDFSVSPPNARAPGDSEQRPDTSAVAAVRAKGHNAMKQVNQQAERVNAAEQAGKNDPGLLGP
jgi:hypothetical protein